MSELQVLDPSQAETVREVCEALVPGCARTGAEVYVDALLARLPDAARAQTLDAFASLAGAVSEGTLAERQLSPEFQLARSLACEAYYSDFVAPGAPGPGAWEEIDFAPPLAARLAKDWSYLGVV